MSVEREIPDSTVVDIADQFCHAAEMLYAAVPRSGPQAMRVNAVFAIELYIKSLDSHWVRHNQLDTLGVDCDAITSRPNKRGHKIEELFDHLGPDVQRLLVAEFASQRRSTTNFGNRRTREVLPVNGQLDETCSCLTESPNNNRRRRGRWLRDEPKRRLGSAVWSSRS